MKNLRVEGATVQQQGTDCPEGSQNQSTDEFLRTVRQSIGLLKHQNENQNAYLLEEYAHVLEEIELK